MGSHIRPRVRAPLDWHLPVGLSLSLEDLQKLQQRIQNRIGLEKFWNEYGYLFGEVVVNEEPIWLRKGYRWFERHFQQLYQAEKANKIWIDNQKTGLSDEDKAWYKEQFAKFDKLEEQIKLGKAA